MITLCGACDGMGCEECDREHYENENLKFVAEDANTLPELVDSLRMCANFYEQRNEDGWILTEPVRRGNVHLHREGN